MALTVTLNGTTYAIPEPGDTTYDQQQLTNYLKALSTTFPQLGNAATQSLTVELDLGVSFGVKALYLKTETATPAATGVVRLAKSDTIAWRSNANSQDFALSKDTSDNLTWPGGVKLGIVGTQVNAIIRGTTGALVFGTVAQDTTAVQTFALVGAAVAGSTVIVSPTAALPAGVSVYAWVSSAGTISVQVVNAAASQAVTATFNITVIQ